MQETRFFHLIFSEFSRKIHYLQFERTHTTKYFLLYMLLLLTSRIAREAQFKAASLYPPWKNP